MKTTNQIVYPVRFDRDEFERLKAYAMSQDLNAAQVIRHAVRNVIAREPDRKRKKRLTT